MMAAEDFDLEIIDDWMFAYFPSRRRLDDPSLWRQLEFVGQKIATHLANAKYLDRRVPELTGAPYSTALMASAPIAAQGSRLRGSYARILIAIILGLAWVFLAPRLMPVILSWLH